jgi:hypothetical protein
LPIWRLSGGLGLAQDLSDTADHGAGLADEGGQVGGRGGAAWWEPSRELLDEVVDIAGER